MRNSSKRINDLDFIGKTFGFLTVVSTEDPNGMGVARKAICKCACGNERRIAFNELRVGKAKSCGCKKAERVLAVHTTHGMSKHPLTPIYSAMIQRCNNPKNSRYKDYGARGVRVCDEWQNDISSFFKWALSNGWKKGLQIDRRKNDLGYSPDNCRIVTATVNQRNKRTTTLITYKGETRPLTEWCEKLGLPVGAIRSRLSRGIKDSVQLFGRPIGRWI